ncbi:MAG TPA: glycosyltransferase family 39 protein [Vicinamibacterales bacterium]|nr:glycosyltransferase family 39 protein [Vicinamibacterales bacterium]
MTSTRRAAFALALVCVLAAGLRMIALQYGLPAVYNPDEAAIMTRALSFGRGTLNPHNFLYPTFYFYVLFVWVAAYLAFVYVTGRVDSIAALQRLFFADPTGIYTAGRLLGVACGTATVFLLYRLAERLTDRRTAIAASLFLATAPLHVRDSHYVKHDVPATLAIVAAYLAIARLWPASNDRQLSTRDTVLAGAACGIAFSTHYYCVFLAIPLALAVIQRWKTRGVQGCAQQVVVAAAASAVLFFALSPFLLVEPVTALRDITANRQIVVDRAVTGGAFAPARRYLEMLWLDAAGQPVALLGILGAVWMLFKHPARAALLLAFPVPFLLFISNTAPASRYLNPVLPFVVLFAAWTLSAIGRRVRATPLAFAALVTLVAAPGLLQSVKGELFLRRDDTRTLAERYIEANVPTGTTILTQPYSAALTPSKEGLTEALNLHLGSAEAASPKFQLQLSLNPYPAPAYRLIYLGRGGLDVDKIYVDPAGLGGPDALATLRRLGVTYVLVKRYNSPDPETLPFVTVLAREGEKVAAFSPYRDEPSDAGQAVAEPFLHNTDARIDEALARPGPPLELWKIDTVVSR